MCSSPEVLPISDVIGSDRIAYAQVPGPRNQDTIRVHKDPNGEGVISVIDGWNNQDLDTDKPGREFASTVAQRFPDVFLRSPLQDPRERAVATACAIDEEMLAKYPAHVSCVGSFLFLFEKKDVLVTIGSVFVLVWNGRKWYRPKAIGDYSLDPQKYPSDVSRFIGRGELKNDPLYSPEPDVVVFPKERIIFVSTDGLEDLFTVDKFNSCVRGLSLDDPREWVSKLKAEVEEKKSRQKDDVSFLLKV